MDLIGSCPVPSVGTGQGIFLLLLQTLSSNYCQLGDASLWPEDHVPSQNHPEEYDFIVVGAGSAGSIVAGRLSENPKWKVLLIEAGGDPPVESNIPLLFSYLWNTKYDWAYTVEKSDKYGRSLVDGPSWPRGKMLGGCSSFNAMIYLRGFAEDYNQWASLGNGGWDYNSVEPLFKRLENNMASNRSASLGTNGPMKIDYPYIPDTARYVVSEAVQEKGYPWVRDFNDGDQVGYTNTQSTIYNGVRENPAKSYVTPAGKRKNFRVLKFTFVTQLIMEGNQVLGVKYQRKGSSKTVSVYAKREVILSAGSINTPHILMHSGIGPAKHLKKIGIKIVSNLSVGRNLQDHLMVFQFAYFPNPPFNVSYTPEQTLDATYAYFKNFNGPFSASGVDFIGFINTKDGPTAEMPNAEVLHAFFEPNNFLLGSYLRYFRYQEKHVQTVLDINKNATVVVFVNILSHPDSRGRIELGSKNVRSPPKIFPNYLDSESDLEILAESLMFHDGLSETNAFNVAGGKFIYFKDLKCKGYPSLEYFKCYVRNFSNTIFHPVGTAKMGPSSDPEAVVDSKLRVKGVRGLRVCDASIMPLITSTNTHAPSMMIGEKCAQLINNK